MPRKQSAARPQNFLHREVGGRLYFLLTGLLLALALTVLSFSGFAASVAGDSLTAQIGISIGGGGGSINIGGGTGGGGGSGTQPGCGGGDCLAPPAPGAYSGIATEASLRSSILKWVNFFLGFFALLAVIALIFAGFLYVTGLGNDEQIQKAKKVIIWVVVGIVVVLIAYALVNSLITFGPQGGEP